MKTIVKKMICAMLLVAGFLFLFGECESITTQLRNIVIGLFMLIADTYLWQWWKMDKYYHNLNDD